VFDTITYISKIASKYLDVNYNYENENKNENENENEEDSSDDDDYTNDDNSNEVDHNILWSKERYDLMESYIKTKKNSNSNSNSFTSFNELKKLVGQHPIINHETVYMCIMAPEFLVTDLTVNSLFSRATLLKAEYEN
jgi:hypothetical protein